MDINVSRNGLGDELAVASSITDEVRDLMLRADLTAAEVKPDGHLVTELDRAIDALVRRRLAEARPYDGVMTEESDPFEGRSGRTWVCDPLDGTRARDLGVPVWNFALALVGPDGWPLVATVLNPLLGRSGERFAAVLGGGTLCNGKRVRVAPPAALGVPIKVGGTGDGRDAPGSVRDTFFTLDAAGSPPAMRRRSGVPTVFKGCRVATGQLDAAIYCGRHAWDAAAIALLVTEAAGRATSIDGNVQRYDREVRGLVVSNGSCHDLVTAAATAAYRDHF
ncbi:Histidinol-phosphatase [Baekduia alba]|uniref:inositol monophosphatase family protein n=1 Tax=Baekduia alba TaxID=2997333 RepID=UPI0023420B4D|nr:inositol monophosphatase family protein [Baekduia alba]WCB95367.1 Histidinol-phosphatase [Baekduia alba]